MTGHPETLVIQHLLAEASHINGFTIVTSENALEQLLRLLRGDWFRAIAGYFENHRSNSPYAQLDDEYKIQDLIYCTALTIIPDLQYEDPQQKNIGAIASTRVDFSSAKTDVFIEAKLATNAHGMKKVEAEIHEDITKYGRRRTFSTLIFFVYCHKYTPPNPRFFERGLTGWQVIDGHGFQTYCIVKP